MAIQRSEQLIPPCADWLHDGTRKVLPTMFAILFIVAGTVVIVYSLPNQEPVPSSFVTGVVITFGLVIALMVIGNFFLYARMRMSFVRSAASSEQSVRIEGERKPWYVRLRTFLDKIGDGPRSFVRNYALRKASTRKPRKKYVGTVTQNQLSQSEIRHRDPNPTIRPVGLTGEIDIERGDRPNQIAHNHFNTTISGITEAPGPMTAPGDSMGTGKRIETSHRPRHQEASQGQPPTAETRIPTAKRNRTRQLVPPEKQLTEQHSLFLTKHEGYGGTRVPASFEVDYNIASESSSAATIPRYSTYQMQNRKFSSDLRVFHLQLPEQQSLYANTNPQLLCVTSNISDSAADVNRI